MNFLKSSVVVLAACVALCASQPTQSQASLPVLKDQPAEVLFIADKHSPVVLECTTEKREKDVKYTWHKNGEVFDWKATGHIAEHPGEGSIVFFNPQRQDEGIYQCFATTSAGVASTRPISLKRAYINAPKVETEDHKPINGKPYKLECPIPNSYPKPTIVWKTQLRSDPSIVEDILNRRLTVAPNGTLWFSSVTKEDISTNFNYICVAQTPAVKGDVVLAEHSLSSLVESKEPNNGELVLQHVTDEVWFVKKGNVTMIYCIYGGTPFGVTNWFKDGKDVNGNPGDRVTRYNRTSGRRLLIKETLLEDDGIYTCEVDNGVGKKQTQNITLIVYSDPEFVKPLEKQIDVKKAHDIEVPCKVTGLPEPKVTWTYNGKPISNPEYKDGALKIAKVKNTDTGYYGCKAENEHGLVYAETLVNVV